MPITQAMSSKGNVKKFTNQDLPFNPQQPVMSSFYAVSTAGQTVINLSFSVDTVNLTDQFFLFVDGKKLRLGASNDYQFTSIGSNGYSSQVTLNQALPINLNIQAYQLGLKNESEFNMDNRFVQLYAAEGAGFQAFVDQNTLMTATSSAGTPAAGTFYSTVVGRASIVDLSQNLKVNMGIDRIMTQSIYQLQNEFGPNGEIVSATPNDLFGQIRFVGDWSTGISQNGLNVGCSTVAGNYIEITFFGTGVNCLVALNGASFTATASVDGGAASGNLLPSASSIINGRNYSVNAVVSLASGLALGIHTVKLTVTDTNGFNFYGFEVLNESSSIKINPGVGYVQAKKYTSSALQSLAYNAAATGTRGGRVVVYQKGDGTIGTAWQAVNASQANLNSADHTNEEVVRSYFWREFAAGRASDDFSTVQLNTVTNARAFTLDDGTTTLACSSPYNSKTDSNNVIDAMQQFNGSSTTITFVGTGLDIVRSTGSGGTNTLVQTVSVDGVSLGNMPTSLGANQVLVQKIVSGLPYGTHTVTITRVSGTTGEGFSRFIVYQPKKPSIPSGSVELADYNVMADYSGTTITGTTVADNLQRPLGVLEKSPLREMVYVGSWNAPASDSGNPSGFFTYTTTLNDYYQYTFFGTGFVLHQCATVSGTYAMEVKVDGVLNATGVARSNVTNSGSGIYTTTSTTGNAPVRVEFTGLTAGVHTVTVTLKTASRNFTMGAFHVIAPIHSNKSNLSLDLQNTLPVGSQGISDNRKTTPVKEAAASAKTRISVVGTSASSVTSTVTAGIVFPEMSATVYSRGAWFEIENMLNLSATSGSQTFHQFYVNGIPVGVQAVVFNTAGFFSSTNKALVYLSAGYHKVEVYWSTNGTQMQANYGRTMTIQEL